MKRALCITAIVAALSSPASAEPGDRPDTEHLVLAGLGMAVPTYFFNVLVHEGTHAIAAKAFGVEVTRLQLLPGRHPKTNRFYFGYTQYRGRLSKGEQTFFLLAPKIPDVVALAAYGALIYFDTVPDNHYGQLAMVVLATGFWVDFTKDLFAFWSSTDVHRSMANAGANTFWGRLPYRVAYAAVAAATGYGVYKGYEKLFEDEDVGAVPRKLIAPLLSGRF